MANSNNSVITGKFRGSLGKELVFREWEGKTVVAKAPEVGRETRLPHRRKHRKDSCSLPGMPGR